MQTQDHSPPQVDLSIHFKGRVTGPLRFLVGQVVSVGRDESCTLALEDLTVSRHHACLQLDPLGVRVEDLSTNGTILGKRRIQREVANSDYGEPICVGETELRLELVRAAPQAATPQAQPSQAAVAASTADASPSHAFDEGEDHAFNELRRQIHRQLLEQLDMSAFEAGKLEDPTLRPRVLAALRRIVQGLSDRLPTGVTEDILVGQMADEALGLGPLEALLADPAVSEIMVLDAHHIYVERSGKVSQTEVKFTDDERVRAAIERIVTPLGRRVDESSPLVDARLADGSRVNVVIRPIALRGSCITIRKFAATPFKLADLVRAGAMSEAMGRFLVRSVRAKKNVVIAGGTGSGKTTLLNVLSAAIPENERIVTIEDAAELQLSQPHVVSLEARPANMEGKGEIAIRDLVRNALRMRPDRIVVGECRGGEALDMLQAMNTGHDGSLTTTHANSPAEALARLETLAMMASVGLPQAALRQQITKSVHLLVQQARLSDGSRKVTHVVEIVGLDRQGDYLVRPIFEFARTGTGVDGRAEGEFRSTGYLPSFLPEMMIKGIIPSGESFL